MMYALHLAVKYLAYLLVIRPLVLLFVGISPRGLENLPKDGPAVIVSNHNSNLDAFILACLFPQARIHKVRPVGAADYFFKSRLAKFLSVKIIGMVPITRPDGTDRRASAQVLEPVHRALTRKPILILFPEGTRGQPERLGKLRSGIAHLAKDYPDIPIVPVWVQNAGRVLPKGSWIPVPFTCEVAIGAPLKWTGDKAGFMQALTNSLTALSETMPSSRRYTDVTEDDVRP